MEAMDGQTRWTGGQNVGRTERTDGLTDEEQTNGPTERTGLWRDRTDGQTGWRDEQSDRRIECTDDRDRRSEGRLSELTVLVTEARTSRDALRCRTAYVRQYCVLCGVKLFHGTQHGTGAEVCAVSLARRGRPE